MEWVDPQKNEQKFAIQLTDNLNDSGMAHKKINYDMYERI
jgi:hypothetical protein